MDPTTELDPSNTFPLLFLLNEKEESDERAPEDENNNELEEESDNELEEERSRRV